MRAEKPAPPLPYGIIKTVRHTLLKKVSCTTGEPSREKIGFDSLLVSVNIEGIIPATKGGRKAHSSSPLISLKACNSPLLEAT